MIFARICEYYVSHGTYPSNPAHTLKAPVRKGRDFIEQFLKGIPVQDSNLAFGQPLQMSVLPYYRLELVRSS